MTTFPTPQVAGLFTAANYASSFALDYLALSQAAKSDSSTLAIPWTLTNTLIDVAFLTEDQKQIGASDSAERTKHWTGSANIPLGATLNSLYALLPPDGSAQSVAVQKVYDDTIWWVRVIFAFKLVLFALQLWYMNRNKPGA